MAPFDQSGPQTLQQGGSLRGRGRGRGRGHHQHVHVVLDEATSLLYSTDTKIHMPPRRRRHHKEGSTFARLAFWRDNKITLGRENAGPEQGFLSVSIPNFILCSALSAR